MSDEPEFERDPSERDDHFDPKKVSPSRVNTLAECGVAFRMKYLEKVPEQVCGSAALFGSVVHAALEKWAVQRDQPLLPLMRSAWITVTEGTVVKDFLAEYSKVSVEAIKQEHAIREAWRAKGKESRAPRMTKEWKESSVAKKINRLLAVWIPKLNAGSPWRFTERDPLAGLYDESLVLAKRYEARWKHLPPALHTEFAFDEMWRGFRLTGYIDSIEPLVSPEGELQGIGVLDYKTYKREPSEHKDWRQLVMYDLAFRSLVERGVLPIPFDLETTPVLVGIDHVRWTDSWELPARRFWRMSDADADRLERELDAYAATVEGRHFLPAAKSTNPDFCNYGDLCCLRSTVSAGGCAEQVEVAL